MHAIDIGPLKVIDAEGLHTVLALVTDTRLTGVGAKGILRVPPIEFHKGAGGKDVALQLQSLDALAIELHVVVGGGDMGMIRRRLFENPGHERIVRAWHLDKTDIHELSDLVLVGALLDRAFAAEDVRA